MVSAWLALRVTILSRCSWRWISSPWKRLRETPPVPLRGFKLKYAGAGVDIDAGNRAVQLIKEHVRSTHRPEVLSELGLFGGLFQLTGFKEPVLVSSADGVGTKLKVACLLDKHDTIGLDIVNHCVNDILTCGAQPLFFLDYLAMGKLIPERVERIVSGIAKACREAGCALIGGETAEMPGIYAESDYDLAGFIVGGVERSQIVDCNRVEVGDVLVCLPSSGLHTNGYSLVRKVFGIDHTRDPLDVQYPELGRTLGQELLEPHRCYYPLLKPVLPVIKALAHITGGGLIENVPRVLPVGRAALFDRSAWKVPPVFGLIQQKGNIEDAEMYRVFNMGLGMVLIAAPQDADRLLALPTALRVGEVVRQAGPDRVVIS
ncbi:MAG: phosphoribosylformylglycinamidine cyclo-ligase [Chloroflexi bacterium]|nr:phosphoribosylformylglycinamidine cyclo-ligase [Chloroflexota bacterium]